MLEILPIICFIMTAFFIHILNKELSDRSEEVERLKKEILLLEQIIKIYQETE